MADPVATTDPTATSAPSNDPSNAPAPNGDNSSADVEQAKKAAEQATMRANQLANELQKIKDSQSEAERKQLEEKEEYKALYEKNDAELKKLREEREANERQAQLTTSTESVFKDYPADVVDVAKTAGLGLTDDSEAARTSLKERLDAIKEKVNPKGTPVASNNPSDPAPANPDRAKLVQDMAIKGAAGDDSAAMQYIGGLSAIDEMRRQAGYPVPER